jgi:hypothetical protein
MANAAVEVITQVWPIITHGVPLFCAQLADGTPAAAIRAVLASCAILSRRGAAPRLRCATTGRLSTATSAVVVSSARL